MFSDDQVGKLRKPLMAEHVKSREAFGSGKLSYIAGFHAIDMANDIFGFDGWSTEILVLKEVNRVSYIKPPYKSGDKEKPMVAIAYMCNLRLSVRAEDGTIVTKEDTGFGDGQAGDTPAGMHSAIELASKEAVTDAIKRCLRAFGNQFGNSLYDKDGQAPIEAEVYEASKVVTQEALDELTELMKARGVDEEWAVAWLSGEGWNQPITELRQDWYNTLYRAVDIIDQDERALASYEEDIVKVMKLMEQSTTMKMLKALFKEVWRKTGEQKDKPRQVEAKDLYETVKTKLEEKK